MHAYVGMGLQCDHRSCHTTRYRKYYKNSEGEEYHGLPTEDIAEFGIDDQEPCCCWSDIVGLWDFNVGTSICEQVGCDHPISRVEAMERVGNRDECRADNGSLDC